VKLRNTTSYDSRVLARLFGAVVSRVAATLPVAIGVDRYPAAWCDSRATFVLSYCDVWVRGRVQGRSSSGCAWLSGRRMVVSFSADMTTVEALWLIQHEVWHLFGLNHRDYPNAVMRRSPSAFAAVAEQYRVLLASVGEALPLAAPKAPKAPKPKPTAAERAEVKLAGILAREKAWTTKQRRAETALTKLGRQRRYYERFLAQLLERPLPEPVVEPVPEAVAMAADRIE
jgi:hypothetical protein